MDIPVFYNYVNTATSRGNPSTVHCRNTALHQFFARYLMQQALSPFKFNLPKLWARNYFLYVLYCWGYIAVTRTDKYGLICQACGLRGYDINYQPTHAVITNPLLSGILEPRIGTQCSLIKLQPDYGGVMDIVSFYADMLALCAEAAGVSLVNSKLAYVLAASNKQEAESLKRMYDQIQSGNPAVAVDKQLLDTNGNPSWSLYDRDVKQSYIASDILRDMRQLMIMFFNDIGIPNTNDTKRERMLVDEVNANNYETRSKCEIWLEEIRRGMAETRELFGLSEDELSVDWRPELKSAMTGGVNNGNNVDTGVV